MRNTIKCSVDSLGRVTLPIQFRKALGIEPQCKVNMIFKNNGMFIYKENEKEIFERKCKDIMSAANTCPDISPIERYTLEDMLRRLKKGQNDAERN